MARYVRGPWIWKTDAPGPRWEPPAGFVGLDLRTLPQQAQQGGTPGLGIFVGTGNPGSDYDVLGQGNWYDVKATQKLRDSLPAPAGYSPKGPDLCGLILDLMTDGADPDGLTGPKPIMPTVQGRIELHIGQSHYERFRWGDGGTPKIKRMLRKEFAQLMQDVQDGKLPSKQHLRVMDFWCEKYGVSDWKEFVPDALQVDVPGREPHQTTITEAFTRADSTSIIGNDLTWTHVSGTWGNYSNQGYKVSTNTTIEFARATSALSSADHYSQAKIININTGDFNGPACRFDNSAATCYVAFESGGTFYLVKYIAAAQTVLGTTSHTFSNGQVTKVQANGSTIKGFVGGAEQNSLTDSAISGNTKCGLEGYVAGTSNNGLFDDFEAADLAASGLLYTQLERNVRGMYRGMFTGF